jgi:hypothetical protein
MKTPTPAKRLHKLASKHGLTISEFSPGLRVWAVRKVGLPSDSEPLAFGVPHTLLADKIMELSRS